MKRIMAAKNYYEMLGVARGCSENDLKKAYRKTSLKVHPDKNKAPGAVEAFQKVAEAFDVLSDERKKEIYDQVGHEQYSVSCEEMSPLELFHFLNRITKKKKKKRSVRAPEVLLVLLQPIRLVALVSRLLVVAVFTMCRQRSFSTCFLRRGVVGLEVFNSMDNVAHE